MKKLIYSVSSLLAWCLFLVTPSYVRAEPSNLQVTVEVIKAEHDAGNVDPRLKSLVDEIAPVLNFRGFALLKDAAVTLNAQHRKENILIPADRILSFEFAGFQNDQAKLIVRIIENKKESFKTTVLIVDGGSVIIGGPPYGDGILLLRISGKF